MAVVAVTVVIQTPSHSYNSGGHTGGGSTISNQPTISTQPTIGNQ